MARINRRSRKVTYRQVGRGAIATSRARSARPDTYHTYTRPKALAWSPRLSSARSFPLSQVQDFRRWNPSPDLHRVSRITSGAPASLDVASIPARRSSKVSYQFPSHVVSFRGPAHVVTCLRRTIRREVMFARGGAGTMKMRNPKRTPESSISCRG